MIPNPNLYNVESVTDTSFKLVPSVFIVMPFEPLVMPKASLENKLKSILYKVESELFGSYTESIANEVLEKLKSVIAGLDYGSHRKGIAIYVSAIAEKVYYLITNVKEAVVVGKPFSVRNIVNNKKEDKKYLLLVLTAGSTRIYVGEKNKLTLRVVNLPEQVATYAGYRYTKNDTRETFLKKFVMHADNVLGQFLKSYSLPLFVMAVPKAKEHFLRQSKNKECVLDYVAIESDNITEKEVIDAIQPFIEDWKKVKEKDLMRQIEQSIYTGKLVAGIDEAWRTAKQSKTKLLVIENSYTFPAYLEGADIDHMKNILPHNPVQLKDAVDDTIENVLKDGGEVEFVEEGVLNDYLHIALVKY